MYLVSSLVIESSEWEGVSTALVKGKIHWSHFKSTSDKKARECGGREREWRLRSGINRKHKVSE